MVTAFLAPNAHYGALRALNYTPDVEALRSKRGASRPLGKLLSSMGPAYGAVFTRIDCAPESGVELVSQGDMFAAEPQGRVIRMDSMARPERHRIQRWQILIAGAGTLGETELYGRSIIADGRLENRYVGPHAMTLTFVDSGSNTNLFAYAFLCSRIGIRALRSTSYGTKILGIRKDLLAELPIPRVDPEVEARVADLIRHCVERRETYLRELKAARRVIEELPEMREALAMCGERKARAVIWSGPLKTLTGATYAFAGEALSHLRRRWPGRLANCLAGRGLFKGGRAVRTPCSAPYGVELLSQRDVFAVRPISRRVSRRGTQELEVTSDMLLLASRGQLSEGALFGRVERALHMPKGVIVTEDITRIDSRADLNGPLYAYLSTRVGLALLRTTAYGTSIPGMREDLLMELPVPDFADPSLRVLKGLVARASSARNDADAAESEAIRIIEAEVLPAWLA